MARQRVLIVGASVAGLSAADTLREEGFDGEIVVLGDETAMPYDRPPLSKKALTGDPEWLVEGRLLRPAGHYHAEKIDLRLGVEAIGLDTLRREVMTTDGPVSYDELIIATGCRARRLKTSSGAHLPVVRTIDDARSLRHRLSEAASAVLIGTGFIGLETAASLRQMGLCVTVIGNTRAPLERQVGARIAGWVQKLHESHGTRIINAAEVREIDDSDGRVSVRLEDGRSVVADIGLAGVGVIPNVEWLHDSPVALRDGVACEASGRTSVPHVWAAGDVAAFDEGTGGRRVEHWTNATEQGRHVALNLLHDSEAPFVSVPYAWSDQYDVKLQTLGRRKPGDETVFVEGTLESVQFLALHGQRGGALNAVTAVGVPPSLRSYRKMLRDGACWNDALAFAGVQTAAAVQPC